MLTSLAPLAVARILWPGALAPILVIVLVGLALYFAPGLDAALRKLLVAVAVVVFVAWVVLVVWYFANGSGL